MTEAIARGQTEHWVIGKQATSLTAIYDPGVTIAIWQRPANSELQQALLRLTAVAPGFQLKTVIDLNRARESLGGQLPDFEGKALLTDALFHSLDLFGCLFDQQRIGLRFNRLTAAMCPRFHVDNIPVRLVQTLNGPGTQWLPEDTLDRSKLGRGNQGLPDHESGIARSEDAIQQLKAGDIALLKGSGWEGNEETGLVHRSPGVPEGRSRWFLSLDLAD